MKFEEALVLMRTGKKLRRACWRTEDSVILNGAVLQSIDKKGTREMEGYVVPSSWLTADDWEIVEEEPPRMPAPDDDGAVDVVLGCLIDTRTWFPLCATDDVARAYLRKGAERVIRKLREYASQKV